MILLVIDMQPRFLASNHKWLPESVADEIRAAKAAKWGIMFLEYTRHPGRSGVGLRDRTHGRLTKLAARYQHAITVHKEGDDGSREVLRAADGWGGAGHVTHIAGGIRVVGVNAEACIANTVNGLSAKEDHEITVVASACNGMWATFHGVAKSPNNMGQDRIVTDGRNVRVLKVAC